MYPKSVNFPGLLGVYPTRDFKAGDVVFQAETVQHKWVSVEEAAASGANPSDCLQVDILKSFRKPVAVIGIGDPRRHIWPNVNSCQGSGQAANLIKRVASREMTDEFVVFCAARYVTAFSEELLLDYPVKYGSVTQEVSQVASEDVTKQFGGESRDSIVADSSDGGAQNAVTEDNRQMHTNLQETESACENAARVAQEELQETEATNEASKKDGGVEGETSYKELSVTRMGESNVGLMDGPQGSQPVPAACMDVEITRENVDQHGVNLADLQTPEGTLWYVRGSERFFLKLVKPATRVSQRLLCSVMGGEIKENVKENILQYDITEKTVVVFNETKKKMKELLNTVQNVYKRTVKGDRLIPMVTGCEIKSIHWCPPRDQLAMVKAILQLAELNPFFMMSIKELDGKATLVPTGVAFYMNTLHMQGKVDFFQLARKASTS